MLRNLSKILMILLSVFLIVTVGTVTYDNVKNYENLKNEEVILEDEIDKEIERQNELLLEIEYSLTESYVEKIAREHLGLIKDNEIIFVDENKK